jgi:hypothetical protein
MTKMFSRMALWLVGIHALIFFALHFMEPKVSPIDGIISDYLTTPSKSLASFAFVVFAIIWVSLAVALSFATQNATIVIGRVLFVLCSLAILVPTAFPEASDPRSSGVIASLLNIFARPGLFVGLLLVSVGIRSTTSLKPLSLKLTLLSCVSFLLTIVTVSVLLKAGGAGVGQRIVFILIYIWIILLALNLRDQSKDVQKA